jgi:DNA polymerase III subunit chi
MTLIEFHSGATDKLDYTCRLLRKASASRKTVLVMGEPESIATLDALLWRFSASSFVAHCRETAARPTLAASPVVLVTSLDNQALKDVLVNIGGSLPTGFDRFHRLIEVVGREQPDVLAGRGRWKDYRRLGYTPTQTAVGEAGGRS